MASDGRATVQLLVDKVVMVTKHYFASFQANHSLDRLTKKHPEIEPLFRGEDRSKPSTHQRELLRDAHQLGLDINAANHLLMPAIDEALKALTQDVVATITDARVIQEPVQWSVQLRDNLTNLMNVALWPWESPQFTVQARCDKGHELTQAINPLVHWLSIGSPGLQRDPAVAEPTPVEQPHIGSAASGEAGMPSISTIPCERTIQAGQGGKDAVGYAFAHYIQNLVTAICRCRDVLHDPPAAWGTDAKGNTVRASSEFAINQAFGQIRLDAQGAIDAWHGTVLAEAERHRFTTAVREEMKDIEGALNALLVSGPKGNSHQLYHQTHGVVARAERRIWALIDSLANANDPSSDDNGSDSDPFFPVSHFEPFGVTGEMLRQAIRKDENGNAKIRSKKPAGRNHYSLNDVKKIWPHLMAQAKRDKA
jgi:hypothetical protein